ncbi:hypothetical protein JRQ81_018817 [Phrynocephalus forsythii]|uniref:Uncharacterized protein n=1 Tax=Phrynocephalus forsythii TaxID=171643 RepID=A0A9Q0XQ94_9SAUR|nr:hypothetical protein JRQ81_018817 [Phrynocephalus forsythii]
MAAGLPAQVMFDDVAVYFTRGEWTELAEWQKDLYRAVMVENYEAVASLGCLSAKPKLICRIERDEDPSMDEAQETPLRKRPQSPWLGDGIRIEEEEEEAVAAAEGKEPSPLPQGKSRHRRRRKRRRTPGDEKMCARRASHAPPLPEKEEGGSPRMPLRQNPPKCPECGKSFLSNVAMTIHIRTHTGERPFRCHLCSKGFPSMGDLKRHLKTHLRPKEPAAAGEVAARGATTKCLTAKLQLLRQLGAAPRPQEAPHLPPVREELQQAPGPAEAPGDPLHRAALRLPGVRAQLPPQADPGGPPEGARRGAALRLRAVREALQPEAPRGEPPARAHGREALRLHHLWQTLRPEAAPHQPPARPHGRAALPLRRVRQDLPQPGHPDHPQPHAHRGAPLPLPPLRQGLQPAPAPQEPPAGPPQRAAPAGSRRHPGPGAEEGPGDAGEALPLPPLPEALPGREDHAGPPEDPPGGEPAGQRDGPPERREPARADLPPASPAPPEKSQAQAPEQRGRRERGAAHGRPAGPAAQEAARGLPRLREEIHAGQVPHHASEEPRVVTGPLHLVHVRSGQVLEGAPLWGQELSSEPLLGRAAGCKGSRVAPQSWGSEALLLGAAVEESNHPEGLARLPWALFPSGACLECSPGTYGEDPHLLGPAQP